MRLHVVQGGEGRLDQRLAPRRRGCHRAQQLLDLSQRLPCAMKEGLHVAEAIYKPPSAARRAFVLST